MEYYGTLVSEGAIASFEPVLLNPSTTDLTGFILIRGSVEQLAALKQQERFKEMMLRGQYLIEGLGVIDGYLDGELQSRMTQWAQVIAEESSDAGTRLENSHWAQQVAENIRLFVGLPVPD